MTGLFTHETRLLHSDFEHTLPYHPIPPLIAVEYTRTYAFLFFSRPLEPLLNFTSVVWVRACVLVLVMSMAT